MVHKACFNDGVWFVSAGPGCLLARAYRAPDALNAQGSQKTVRGDDAPSGDFDLVAADVYFDPAGPAERVPLLDDYGFGVDDFVRDEKCGERSGGAPSGGILGDSRDRIEESRDHRIEAEEITPLSASLAEQGSEACHVGLRTADRGAIAKMDQHVRYSGRDDLLR